MWASRFGSARFAPERSGEDRLTDDERLADRDELVEYVARQEAFEGMVEDANMLGAAVLILDDKRQALPADGTGNDSTEQIAAAVDPRNLHLADADWKAACVSTYIWSLGWKHAQLTWTELV